MKLPKRLFSSVQLSRFVQKNWGLTFLLLYLGVILLRNLNASYFVVGWDNFSTSLDILLNLPRTLFASWREYRGFGGTSDSEVVDVFRQLVQLGFLVFLPQQFAEQVLYVFLFVLGAVGMFLFAKKNLDLFFPQKKTSFTQASALVAALAYISNLFAFDTFQFPIAMYVIRFGVLPVFLYSFLILLSKRNVERKHIFAFISASILISGAYLTATVFFTVLICLGILSLFFIKRIRRVFTVGMLFIALNAFWLLLFGYYYITRADLLPQASSFTEVNESLLNKPASTLSWQNLLTFYPETISRQSLPFQSLADGEPWSVHQLIEEIEVKKYPVVIRSLLTPFALAVLGIIFSLAYAWRKKKVQHLWVTLLFFTMLFFLRKEQAPLGFFYDFLGNTIPYFRVVLRFGSAKFSPYLLVATSLLAAFGCFGILKGLSHIVTAVPVKLVTAIVVLPLATLIIFPFPFYSRGELFNPLVKTQIPSQYFSLAKFLNSESRFSRVLHLPIDEFSYWKSYSWGYFGSSFLNFMIQKPLIDRTFEPANIELDYFLQAVRAKAGGYEAESSEKAQRRASELLRLLKLGGVEFVIFDESVGTVLPSHGVRAWGVFKEEEYSRVLQVLLEQGELAVVFEQEIEAQVNTPSAPKLIVYKVRQPDQIVRSLHTATNVDPSLEDTFFSPLLREEYWIQSPTRPYVTFPFWQPKKEIEHTQFSHQLVVPTLSSTVMKTDTSFVQSVDGASEAVFAVFLEKDANAVRLTVAQQNPFVPLEQSKVVGGIALPDTLYGSGEAQVLDTSQLLSNTHARFVAVLEDYRVRVADQVFYLPAQLSGDREYLGSIVTTSSSFNVELLRKAREETNFLPRFAATIDPNCYRDRTPDYEFFINRDESGLWLATRNGMTCMTTGLVSAEETASTSASSTFHYELDVEFSTNISEERRIPSAQFQLSPLGHQVRESITAVPSYETFTVCLLEPVSDDCINSRQIIAGQRHHKARVVQDKKIPYKALQLLVILPSVQDTLHELLVKDITLHEYAQESLGVIRISRQDDTTQHNGEDGILTLHLPQTVGTGSFLWNPRVEGLSVYTHRCENENGYRTAKVLPDLPILTYIENCSQSISHTLPLNPDRMYVWSTDYTLLSGKYPKFVATHATQFLNQYLSRYTGYPNIEGFKSLQIADRPWWTPDARREYVENELNTPAITRSSVLLSPLEFGDALTNARLEVAQNAENQGIVGIRSFGVTELPASWRNLALQNGDYRPTFSKLRIESVQRYVPSLWKVTLRPETEQRDPYLLQFGQAFDPGWRVFVGARQLEAEHVKVNGWSNGWIIPYDALAPTTSMTIYIFFVPELLSLLGWGITLLAVVLAIAFLRLGRSQRHRHGFISLRRLFVGSA